VFTFSKFQGVGILENEASALTGIPYFVNTGNSIYGLSGILITNPGSGYDSNIYVPKIRVKRQSTDPLGEGGTCSDTQYTTKSTCEAAGTCSDNEYTTKESCENASATWTPKVWADGGDNFSGEFFLNKSGTTYNFTDVWNIETGLVDSSTSILTGADFKLSNYIVNDEEYSHTTSLPADHTQFYTALTFNNLDIDEAIKAKLTISGDGQLYESTISIQNLHAEDTGMAFITEVETASAAGSSFVATYFS
jgi:hypothetical protein